LVALIGIGSDFDQVYGFNFLPETGLDRNLGLRQKLHNRVQEIHDTLAKTLPSSTALSG